MNWTKLKVTETNHKLNLALTKLISSRTWTNIVNIKIAMMTLEAIATMKSTNMVMKKFQ